MDTVAVLRPFTTRTRPPLGAYHAQQMYRDEKVYEMAIMTSEISGDG